MTTIKFTKMHGLGNDFVILDYEEYIKTGKDASVLAKILCERHLSIGADGLIVVNQNVTNADIGWIFYNADGSTAQMCGNGMRCYARYLVDRGIINKKTFTVETLAGIIQPEIVDANNVCVNMGMPILAPEKIPFKGDASLNYKLTLASGNEFEINAVSMGNPHCIIFTNENSTKMALKYGSEVEVSPEFPEKTNVEFVKVISRNEIQVDVWERGCGITQACGTGACASVVAAALNGLCDSKVKANLPGGSLFIEWAGSKNDTQHNVYMTGPATYSFIGEVDV